MRKLFALLCLFCTPLLADMPEPYRSIHDLPFDGQGWFYNADQLRPVLEAKKPMTVIEIGSWLGTSTRFIASHMPEGGVLYAIDTWLGTPGERPHMDDPRLPFLYQLFLSNVKHAGLTNKIVPVRMTSMEASRSLNLKADLIYIDGAHDTISVYNDIMAWYPHLKEGGIMCGDDWFWWPSVRSGVTQAARVLNRNVIGSENFWSFE